jgi:hypothetical protein
MALPEPRGIAESQEVARALPLRPRTGEATHVGNADAERSRKAIAQDGKRPACIMGCPAEGAK